MLCSVTSTFGLLGFFDIRDHVFHVPGREELALFHIHHTAGFRGGDEWKPSPATEESRDLGGRRSFRHVL